jgi:CheY-like chemotaxis protein
MKKILVIEDIEDNLYLIKFILEKQGFKVFTTMSGKEGVNLAREVKPNLVIIDIQLPDISGVEVLGQLKEKLERNTPLIVLTAHAMPEDREKFLSLGATSYIQKPIRPEIFAEQISKFL